VTSQGQTPEPIPTGTDPTEFAPTNRRILRLSASALVVLIAEPLYLMLDLAVVGRLGGVDLAALGVGVLVLSVVSTQLTFLSYGTTARSAQRFGAGDRAGAVGEGLQATWIALAVGAVIVGVVQATAPWIMAVLTGGGDVADDAVRWLRIAVCGVPLILLSMAGNGWMRGVQDTRRPIIYVVAGLGLSAMLCPLLVHGLLGAPDLGLVGSAVANVIGQSVAGALFAARVWRESVGSIAGRRPHWPTIVAQLSLGRDLIVRSLAFQVCFLSAAAVASRFGVAAVASHQLVLQLWNFVALLLDSFAIAAQALVGAALGARAVPAAWRVARHVIIWSFGVSVILAAAFAAGHAVLPTVFTSDTAVLDAVATPWWFFVVMLPVAGIVFALDGVLLGSADAAFLRTSTLLSALVGFLPLIWLSLVFDWGLAGIWTGLVAFMVLRLITAGARVRSGRWTVVAAANPTTVVQQRD
jgi:putative MATE family efflux protein